MSSSQRFRPPFSLLAGPDSRLVRLRLDALLGEHPPDAAASSGLLPTGADGAGASWQRFVFWGDDGLPPAFWEHLTLQGLFARPKALLIRNAEALPIAELRKVSEALLRLLPRQGGSASGQSPSPPLPSPLIWPMLCFNCSFDKGKVKLAQHIAKLPCYLAAEKGGWLDLIPPLAGQALGVFIKNAAAQHGICLSREQLGYLLQALPPDAAAIDAEMARLALLADGEGKLPADLGQLGAQQPELGIFELLRAVQQQGRAPEAWKRILEDRLSGENMVFAFTAIMLREARTLWQCLAGPAPYLPGQLAAQKKITAKSLGYAGIARLWELALHADKGIKSGERSPEQAFEMLAADLFLLFGRPGRA
ncbi:DNA polymerase III subunit delta [Desulfovibrio sp. OttesenSCG-928-A18]|nr:DNA polymerase III subunit delta [Desulfovibrio sp. OttesenSCG-928-A18]